VITQLIEKSKEFNIPLWLVLIDYSKAFDSVDHTKLWVVLRDQGVPEEYIVLLQRLYSRQTSYVRTDVSSIAFPINRGVRQGDPISALLFIAVMEHIFARLKTIWRKANMRRTKHFFGIRLSDQCDTLSNLRFADDCVLVAQSKTDAKKMLERFIIISEEYGLSVHADKTKLVTWDRLSKGICSISVQERIFAILSETDSEKYLGRKLSFSNCHDVELRSRIAAGWSKFHAMKTELIGSSYHVSCRIRYFDAAITATVLYGCCTWALTRAMIRELDVARRKMLRYVLRIFRRRSKQTTDVVYEEEWADYLKRAARTIEKYDDAYGLETWSHTFKRRKWNFAGRLARANDQRWSHLILDWVPDGANRSVGRPLTRWEDDLVSYAGGNWMGLALLWCAHSNGFVNAHYVFVVAL